MIPVVLAGDWSAASPRARTWFVLGALGDVGFDLYHGLKTVLAVFADNDRLHARHSLVPDVRPHVGAFF